MRFRKEGYQNGYSLISAVPVLVYLTPSGCVSCGREGAHFVRLASAMGTEQINNPQREETRILIPMLCFMLSTKYSIGSAASLIRIHGR